MRNRFYTLSRSTKHHAGEGTFQQVAEDRYGSASEAIRAGLRLLEERETRLAALRQALREGEESGLADYSLQGLLDELDSESPN